MVDLINFYFPFDISDTAYTQQKIDLGKKIEASKASFRRILNHENNGASFKKLTQEDKNSLGPVSLSDLYIQQACSLLKEAFQSFDYDQPSCYYCINLNLLMEASNKISRALSYIYSPFPSQTSVEHIYFLQGFIAYILDNKDKATTNLHALVNTLLSSKKNTFLIVPTFHLLCLLEKGTPACLVHFYNFKQSILNLKLELENYAYIRAQHETEVDKNNHSYFLYWVFKVMFKQRPEEAIPTLQAEIEENPKRIDHYYYLYWAFKAMFNEMSEQAITFLQEGIKAYPACIDYYYYIGLLTNNSEYYVASIRPVIGSEYQNLSGVSVTLNDNKIALQYKEDLLLLEELKRKYNLRISASKAIKELSWHIAPYSDYIDDEHF